MSTPSQPLPPKKEVALALLERSSVHIHLDPRLTGVVVPTWFKKQAQLVLQIGLNMPVPIPDLRLDDDGMSCTLSFNRSPFFCFVPWSSVFAMVGEDKRGMVWPDDVPPEIAGLAGSTPGGVAAGGGKVGDARKDAPPKRMGLAIAPAPPPSAPSVSASAASAPSSASTSSKSARAEPAARPKRTRKKPAAAAAGSSEAPAAARGPRGVPKPVALPTPVAAPAQVEAPPPQSAAPRAPAGAAGGVGGAGAARKPKRELPPYLRVVK